MMPRPREAPKSAGRRHTAVMSVRRLVIGGTLLAAGVLVGVVGVVWAFRGFLAIDASVVADGEPHVVDIGAGEHFIWVDSSVTAPTCEVTADGAPLALRPVAGSFTRSYGSAGPWEARWWFDAPTASVSITCDGTTGSDQEAVEIGPRVAGVGLVGNLLAAVGLAAVLVLGGGILLLVTVVRGLAARTLPEVPQAGPPTT